MMWNIVIPIFTLIVGAVAGFFIGIYYLRAQMEKMQKDPAKLKEMAKKMGYNMNNRQMSQVQQMLKKNKF